MKKNTEDKLVRVAAIQMASGPNVSANLLEAKRLINKATADAAKLVVLPENFAIMGMREKDKVEVREIEGSGPMQEFLSDMARVNKIWIVGGTIPLATADPHRVRAATLIFDDQGRKVARYDKAHLFDVHIAESGENYAESQTIEAGDEVVVVPTPFGNVGIGICYDLRFPELFRNMLQYNVEIIVLPSAFTAITGRAHWETLVKARAIENLSYVIAADQGGYHLNGRESYGDSMIVDPWGNILDRLPNGSGYVCADINLKSLHDIRRNFPVLEHRKLV